MSIKEDIIPYLEKKYPFVGLYPNPGDRSEDNLILFTCIYRILAEQELSFNQYLRICELIDKCQIQPGLLARYPGEVVATSHDDITAACTDCVLATEIYIYGHNHFWSFGDNPLWRIIGFPSHVKNCAGLKLNLFDQLLLSLSFIGNLWENRLETSGKQLLWIKAKMVWGKYKLVDIAIKLWKRRMKKLYPAGLSELFEIFYRDQNHPFILNTKDRTWDKEFPCN